MTAGRGRSRGVLARAALVLVGVTVGVAVTRGRAEIPADSPVPRSWSNEAPQSDEASEEPAPSPVLGFSTVMDVVQRFVAPTSLVVALVYYFGWVRVHATYHYFGVDVGELDLGTTDYLLRSPDALVPLVLAVLSAVAAVVVLQRLVVRLTRGSARRQDRARLLLRVVALATAVAGVALVVADTPWVEAPPTLLVVTFTALLLARAPLLSDADSAGPARRRPWDALHWLLVAMLCVSVFWAAARLADDVGRGEARTLEVKQFATLPDVVLYSTNRLAVDAQDVKETDLGPSYARHRYKYMGYKLLSRTPHKLLLIPWSWSTANSYTLVLPDNEDLVLVYAPNF